MYPLFASGLFKENGNLDLSKSSDQAKSAIYWIYFILSNIKCNHCGSPRIIKQLGILQSQKLLGILCEDV